MAQFEGVQWATKQLQYLLEDRKQKYLEGDAKTFAVSRSIHYGLFLAFEGIRFFCTRDEDGKLKIVFFNWDKNLERFQRGIAFNLGQTQQHLVPGTDELEQVFLDYFRRGEMRDFLNGMANSAAQGYLRPFTIDEDQSIGVTFPSNPAIRAVVCRYDRYLGEPFNGVVIPNMVRAIGINGTGCLKLGINYLMSVRAVDQAKTILPDAASALFLDDNPFIDLYDRKVTEWDSSCCLVALSDGTVIKIPESNLILPSVTIQGITAILKDKGVSVIERDISYGELIEKSRNNEIVTICSIGTAGILNRCSKLLMIDEMNKPVAEQNALATHELFQVLGEIKSYYWDIYKGQVPVPPGMRLQVYSVE